MHAANYLNTNSKMAVPPPFWLQRLYDYDAELVVFPSAHRPYAYVLARRQRRSLGPENKVLADVITQPDTKFCLSRGLVPVTLIHRTGTSWPIDNIIADLKSRDIWAHGGGDKAADIVDKREADERAAIKRDLRDDMWMRSGQAWESFQRRSGQRVSVPGRTTEQRPPTSSGSTAGLGLVLTDAQ